MISSLNAIAINRLQPASEALSRFPTLVVCLLIAGQPASIMAMHQLVLAVADPVLINSSEHGSLSRPNAHDIVITPTHQVIYMRRAY